LGLDPEPVPFQDQLKKSARDFAARLWSELVDFFEFVGVLGTVVILAVLLIIGVVVYGAWRSESDWPEFSRAHNCVTTGETRTTIVPGSIQVDKVIVPTSSSITETKYRCDIWH
jgi:hypothetical protein